MCIRDRRIRITQLPLRAFYGGNNPKAESGIFIYLDFYHIYNIINKQALTVFLIFNHKKLKFLHNKTRVFPKRNFCFLVTKLQFSFEETKVFFIGNSKHSFMNRSLYDIAVSYTHLDVYKRQS